MVHVHVVLCTLTAVFFFFKHLHPVNSLFMQTSLDSFLFHCFYWLVLSMSHSPYYIIRWYRCCYVFLSNNAPMHCVICQYLSSSVLFLLIFPVRNRLREIVGASTNWKYVTVFTYMYSFCRVIVLMSLLCIKCWIFSIFFVQRSSAIISWACITKPVSCSESRWSSYKDNEGQRNWGTSSSGYPACLEREIPQLSQQC